MQLWVMWLLCVLFYVCLPACVGLTCFVVLVLRVLVFAYKRCCFVCGYVVLNVAFGGRGWFGVGCGIAVGFSFA